MGLSCKVGRDGTEEWQCEGKPLCRIRQGLCDDAEIGSYICARTSTRIRQHAGKERCLHEQDPKVRTSAHVFGLLCFGLCAVFVQITVRASACDSVCAQGC